jgi:hypothetical protein
MRHEGVREVLSVLTRLQVLQAALCHKAMLIYSAAKAFSIMVVQPVAEELHR